jgi:hypothetical protein
MGSAQSSRALNRDVDVVANMSYSKQRRLHLHACTEKSTVCPSVSDASNCSSQILLHRSWAPAKKAIPRDRRDEVEQSKNASQTRQCSFLGDWNAGKEDDSLPGPNFDVPRDLFRGTMSEKRVQVVHWLCNSISRHCVNTRDRRPRQIETGRTMVL